MNTELTMMIFDFSILFGYKCNQREKVGKVTWELQQKEYYKGDKFFGFN